MKYTSEQILEKVILITDDKLAQDTVALDVRGLTPIADFFVITQGKNEKHVDAIVQAVLEEAHKQGMDVKNIEGRDTGKWTLIDLNDVIVHVFYPSEREHYQLEKLWHDAPLYDIAKWVN
ncbi:ribosome silencing factor [Granulicatella sp. zg-ZJ]|uniref:ribosome silencing factor n=1 Tax=unclassified Granulicatella TaxID=2630493 RepID=UPI0013BF3FA2|nr:MULTISPECIES: ribosome silencing factor [unclassified Granulicatella]NEW63189.1 ribosome silencing factor [Granulicatella sp. zg-ZJ]NEW66504.1 ribosome silencing factor [Granulicatella sp. zg-84]QMI85508.1 ribosome silencing factor [Carnobacteriaceae bacterium zg-84]